MPSRQFNNRVIPVFVYGTLKIDEPNHRLIEDDAEYVDTMRLHGFSLVDLGPFPAVVEGGHYVVGQLFMVNEQALRTMDHLEGHPDFYHRIWVDETPSRMMETNGFWMYVMDPEQVADNYVDDPTPDEINRVIKSITIRDGKW